MKIRESKASLKEIRRLKKGCIIRKGIKMLEEKA